MSICEDTIQAKLPFIEVEASKELRQKVLNTFSNTQISDSLLARFGLEQVMSALSYAPGVYIRDYAGIGGVKTISLRGFASPNTLIMIEGLRLNSTQNGTFDLNLLPSSLLNGFEIFRSGSSFIFGGNASAGLLNFRIQSEKKTFNSKISISSFNTYEFSCRNVFRVKPLSINLGISFLDSKGNYPFQTNQLGKIITYKRENSNFINLSAFASIKNEKQNPSLSFFYLTSYNHRGVPGAVVQNKIESKKAYLDDIFVLTSFQTLFEIKRNSTLTFNINLKLHNEKFFDPEGIGIVTKKETSRFDNTQFTLFTNFESKLSTIDFNLTAEITSDKLIGDFLNPEVKGKVHRFSFALGTIISKEVQFLNIRTQTFISYRFDHSNDFGAQNSFGVGAKMVNIFSSLDIAPNFSINFRSPSFNEMYYLNYGTINLKPEKNYSFNIDFSLNKFHFLEPNVSLFYYLTLEKIISIPKNPIQWSAQNLGKTKSYGIEVSSKVNFPKISAIISYSFQITKDATENSITLGKQLPYTPKELLSFSIKYLFPYEFSIKISHLYSGKRYALPDNSVTSKLPSYSIWNTGISRELTISKLKFVINLEISNIFNKGYEIFINYPMPGRSFKLTIKTIV